MKYENYLIKEIEKFYGIQKIYKFDNGYGASVVKNDLSYGGDEGLFELAVIKFNKKNKIKICYDTHITNDVIGWLTLENVDELLEEIKKLNENGEK